MGEGAGARNSRKPAARATLNGMPYIPCEVVYLFLLDHRRQLNAQETQTVVRVALKRICWLI